jgi:hypothetical protein
MNRDYADKKLGPPADLQVHKAAATRYLQTLNLLYEFNIIRSHSLKVYHDRLHMNFYCEIRQSVQESNSQQPHRSWCCLQTLAKCRF